MKLIFIDNNPLIVKCWKHHYQVLSNIYKEYNFQCHHNIKFSFYNHTIEHMVQTYKFNTGKTSIVTPANSLNYMGGGFDLHLLNAILLGTNQTFKHLENIIQNYQLQRFQGYLVPNQIYKINLTDLSEFDYTSSIVYKNWNLTEIIEIPTMVVPEKIHSISHLFDSIWNLMSNINFEKGNILVLPGIGTGYGNLNEYESTKIMLFAIFLYNLSFTIEEKPSRLDQLKKSLLILFFFNKDYRKLENHNDIEELETYVISDYGQNLNLVNGTVMELEQVFKCIRW
ncbi:conserved hypothetical protein [Candida dubliniensis CD36]|uniref:Macro-like domain-containing protein n=1 Tax=Candida dubliniensis (strain CD36 / ATCC MYA-646 / CBS 7987 / NCPF 3949 / NRRL Y-17841) TaxID=573826 RepID=B9W7J1_CANDC|nr:conserved hypothetical protein [Candida dubliniensis CD36]CAX44651.1 conserved hypothetical protein [Candida dubliniensis CD36]